MRTVIQRVSEASVTIDGTLQGQIENGLLLLVGFEDADDQHDLEWTAKKILNMRIFNDENGVMNKSILETNARLLIISQFTLHASTKKGNRPSYLRAAKPDKAIPLYEKFLAICKNEVEVEEGLFGADMKVQLINDGPVTIIIDSKNRA